MMQHICKCWGIRLKASGQFMPLDFKLLWINQLPSSYTTPKVFWREQDAKACLTIFINTYPFKLHREQFEVAELDIIFVPKSTQLNLFEERDTSEQNTKSI